MRMNLFFHFGGMALIGISTWAAPASDWTTHKNPLGFTVQTPAGWQVAADAKSGRVELAGPQQQIMIWPVFIPGALEGRSAGAVLGKMVAAAGINAVWGPPQALGASAIRSIGYAGDRAALCALTWIPSPQGNAGYVYVLSAPPPVFRQSLDTFARVLSSFRITGQPAPKQPAAKPQGSRLSYVRWQDPRENAFSLEAPAGWKVEGGLYRFASVDVRSAWQAVSADGLTRVASGDPEIPTFTEPDPMLAMTGFQEGTWYSPGYGVRMFVRRYLPGAVFAREYVAANAQKVCSGLALNDGRDRPDAEAVLRAEYEKFPLPGVSKTITAGEIYFTCNKDGRALSGYYFASTERTQTMGMPGGLWNVRLLCGFLTPEGKAEEARAIMNHMVGSVRTNTQWAATQRNITANTSRIVSETNDYISNIITSTYERRQAVNDEISRRRSNATLGVVDVIDPVTGRQYKVENSGNYYWIDTRGCIVGTQVQTSPGVDFRELTQLP